MKGNKAKQGSKLNKIKTRSLSILFLWVNFKIIMKLIINVNPKLNK